MILGLTQGTAHGEDYLEHTARLGLTGVEPFIGSAEDERLAWSGADLERFVARARNSGVQIPSVAVGLFNNDSAIIEATGRSKTLDLTSRALEFSAGVGANVMLLCTYVVSHPDTPEKKTNLLEVVREVEPLARKLGVAIALETPLPAEELAELTDAATSEFVGVYYDFGNAVFLGFDPAREVRVLGKRIMSVHVKDSAEVLGGLHLGEGKLDLASALEALRSIRYEGWLMLETPGDDEAAVRKDIEVLSGFL